MLEDFENSIKLFNTISSIRYILNIFENVMLLRNPIKTDFEFDFEYRHHPKYIYYTNIEVVNNKNDSLIT